MVNILDNNNSILNTFIAEIRNSEIQTDSMRFRRNLERVGEIMAYEISKTLDYKEEKIHTPLGTADVDIHTDNIVLATILRAGLPFHQGFLNYFDTAENSFITAYRKYHKDESFDIKIEYISTVSIEDKTLIIVDPMLATGASMKKAIEKILHFGKPKHIHIAGIISSRESIEDLKKSYYNKNVTIWTGSLDDELTAKSYIVPGLGDAGDLAFGKKE